MPNALESSAPLVWVVAETSDAGDTTIGVFSTLTKARDAVSALAGDRLDAYRIEAHVFDQSREEPVPWHVVLTREGLVEGVAAFVGCNCQDDEAEYYRRSFIEDGGGRMYVIAFALTPGLAVESARRYRAWLLEQGIWQHHRLPLHPIAARPQAGVAAS